MGPFKLWFFGSDSEGSLETGSAYLQLKVNWGKKEKAARSSCAKQPAGGEGVQRLKMQIYPARRRRNMQLLAAARTRPRLAFWIM